MTYYSDKGKMRKNSFVILIMVLFICVPIFSKESTVMLLAEIFSLLLFAVSINLLLGYTGMIPFGHAAFYGVGVYSFAIMLKQVGLSLPLAMVLAPIIASLLGIIIGFFCIRLVGLKFAMLSLAFGQIVWAIIYKWYSFTGGDNGIMDIPLPKFLYETNNCYYFILIIVVLSLLAVWKIINSPFGWTLESIRENAQRVYFIGTDARRYQLIAFVISSFFAGLAGALFVLISHNAFPEYVFWSKGGEGLIMVVLGGMYSFFGPIIGAFVMVLLHTFILTHTEYWPFFLGAILIVIMLFAPQGIVGIVGKIITIKK